MNSKTSKYQTSDIILWLATGFVAATYFASKLYDPDLWWHITVGKWIVTHGMLPETELWNRFAEGKPWTAYSWSAEALYGWVYLSFGLYGLYCLKFITALIFVYSAMFCAGRVAKNMVFGAFVGLAIVVAFKLGFALRPQCLSWILLMYAYLAADTLSQNSKSMTAWVGLALIALFWANVHLSFILGFGTVALWMITLPPERKNIQLVILACAVMFLATLITPSFGQQWITLFSKADHPFMHSYIREFKPTTIYHPGACIVLILGFLLGLFYHYQPSLIRWPRLFLVAGFSLVGFLVLKFMAFAVIGTAFLVASVWSGIGSPKALGNLGEGLGLAIDNIKALDAKKKVIISVVCIACSLPVFIYRGIDPVHLRLVPKAATDFIVENELPAPILNSFGIGGYIMYRFSNPDGTPRIKVPIDGRTNVNSPEITKAFVEALQGTYKWTDMMDLVKPRTIIWDVEHPLTTILLVHPDYCLVYPEKQEDLDKETYAVFLTKQDCPTWWSKIAKEILPEALVH